MFHIILNILYYMPIYITHISNGLYIRQNEIKIKIIMKLCVYIKNNYHSNFYRFDLN